MKDIKVGGSGNPHGRDDTCIQNVSPKIIRQRHVWTTKNKWEDNIKTVLMKTEYVLN